MDIKSLIKWYAYKVSDALIFKVFPFIVGAIIGIIFAFIIGHFLF